MIMKRLWQFLKLSRPHFLVGGALLYLLGVDAGNSITAGRYLLGQVLVSSAQITAHYVNEYADLEVDRAVANRTLFSGGSGVLVDGGLDPHVAMRAAWACSGIALAAAALVAVGHPMTALLGLLALVVSWAYSMPPLRLLGTGWGELATTMVVTGMVPLIGVTVTGAHVPAALWWSIAVLAPIHMAMMLVFELPDLQSDRSSGKLVLAARLGRASALILVGALLVLAVVLLVARLAVIGSVGLAGIATGVALVVGSVVTVRAASRRRHGLSTALAVALLAMTTIALMIGNGSA